MQVLAIACDSSATETRIQAGPFIYSPRAPVPAGDHPTSVAAADLDGDGDPDLIVSSFWTEELIVFENQGGEIAFAASIPLFGYPGEVIAGELDGVPGVEIAVVRSVASQVSFFQPDPEAWLVPGPADLDLVQPSTLESADLDGDGRLELMGSRFSPGRVRIAHGDASGFGLDVEAEAPEGAVAMAAGDLDGDGIPEVAVVGATVDTVAVLGRDLTPRTTAPTPSWPSDVTAVDLDGDGGPLELVVPGNLGDEVAIFAGRGAGLELTLERRASLATGSGPISTTAADLDGDGRLELLIAEKTGFAISIWGGPWDAPVRLGALEARDGPTPILLVDLDGDGRDDVVTVAAFANEVQTWLAR